MDVKCWCRTCGSNSCQSEWRGSQRTQAQGTHLQTTGEYAVRWLRALLGKASRFKTQFALAARAVTPQWSSWPMLLLLVWEPFFTHPSNKSADAMSRLCEGAALPQMLDHVPRLPAPDRETAFKVWSWRMWTGLARKENHDFVTVYL